MAFKRLHLKDLIERTLKEDVPSLYSDDAVDLLLGTCAQESLFGTYLVQLGLTRGKGGLGVFQMEKVTFNDLLNRYRAKFPIIRSFTYDEMEWNLRAAIIMARIKYYSCPGPIPKDLAARAAYWDLRYNCNPNFGTVEEYLANYKKYVERS